MYVAGLKKKYAPQFILPYTLAQYYEAKKCSYIAYYVLAPATGKYKRKRIKLNRIKKSHREARVRSYAYRHLRSDEIFVTCPYSIH